MLFRSQTLQRTEKQRLMLPTTFRSYTQGGILTTELPTKCCSSNILFTFYKVSKPDLRIAVVVVQHFFTRPGLKGSISGLCRAKLLFLRMRNRTVALSRAKKNIAYRNHRQMVVHFSTKQRQKKTSRTTAFSVNARLFSEPKNKD